MGSRGACGGEGMPIPSEVRDTAKYCLCRPWEWYCSGGLEIEVRLDLGKELAQPWRAFGSLGQSPVSTHCKPWDSCIYCISRTVGNSLSLAGLM